MNEEDVVKAMENRFDGVDKFDIVQELLELEVQLLASQKEANDLRLELIAANIKD